MFAAALFDYNGVLARDPSTLNDLLGGRLQMMCILFPADGEEKKDGEEPAEGDTPAEDTPKESIHRGGMH